MKTRTTIMTALAVCGALSSLASATPVLGFDDPSVLAPCDDATVTVEWIGHNAGLDGTLSWINTGIANTTPELFDSGVAGIGDKMVLDRTFALGERIDFQYAVYGQGGEVYRTDVQADWGQFWVEQVDRATVLVHVEDIRLPRGDHDYNDAVFKVSFSHVPSPGPAALFGAGMLMMGGRRRR